MEEALDNVVKKFDETSKSLKSMEDQVEGDLLKRLQNLNPEEDTEDKASLLQKLNEVKQDYSDIKKEALELGKLQREMAVAFQQQLVTTVQKLQALTDNDSASANSSEEAATALNSLIEQSEIAENLTNKLKNDST